MGSILPPAKLYLDTNHLVGLRHALNGNQAADGDPYMRLWQLIRAGFCAVVFCPFSCLEWVDGGATENTAMELADLVDCARLSYLIDADQFVYLREVLDAVTVVMPGLNVPQYEIMFQLPLSGDIAWAASVLAQIPKYREAHGVNCAEGAKANARRLLRNARDWTQDALRVRQSNEALYRQRVLGFANALQGDIQHRERLVQGISTPHRVHWMRHLLRAHDVIAFYNPTLADADTDALLAQVDINRCPATKLLLDAWYHRVRAGHKVVPSDVGDWAQTHIVPYVDAFLTERQYRDFLLRADGSLRTKVFARPKDALDELSRRGYSLPLAG